MDKSATAIEFLSSFSFMGTIEKMETFNSKGGGLKIIVQTGELDKAIDILTAKGNVCQLEVKVSKQKSIEPGDDDPAQEGLDFDDIAAKDDE